jgi:alkylated DNA nucleotide flippase Atl1
MAGVSALDDYSSRVLDVVDAIPPGQVMSYGDIAEYVGAGGPRQVGRVLALHGGGVAWWRVIRADGTPPPGHQPAALAHYLAEGTPLRSFGLPVRVDMRRARCYLPGEQASRMGGPCPPSPLAPVPPEAAR